MFYDCKVFNQPMDKWDVKNVKSMGYALCNCPVFNQNLNTWNTSNVTDMSFLFLGASSYNQPMDKWDVSKVTDMRYMFKLCTLFNQDISNWNTSNITSMYALFDECRDMECDLSKWDVSKISTMDFMFGGTSYSKGSPNISGWRPLYLTQMNWFAKNNPTFNEDLSGWDVSRVFQNREYDLGATTWLPVNKPRFA
jgi:surface protein